MVIFMILFIRIYHLSIYIYRYLQQLMFLHKEAPPCFLFFSGKKKVTLFHIILQHNYFETTI